MNEDEKMLWTSTFQMMMERGFGAEHAASEANASVKYFREADTLKASK